MRDQILDIAVEQMKDAGYHNLSFANIAETLSTTRANIHHHFKNKEGLGLAATLRYIETEKANIDSVFSRHDGDLETILKKLEQHLLDLLKQSSSANPCILSQLINDSEAPRMLRNIALERCAQEEGMLEEQIKKARKTGTLKSKRTDKQLAFQIMSTMFGVMQMGSVNRSDTALAKQIRGCLASVLE